jgi:hypothetical protein
MVLHGQPCVVGIFVFKSLRDVWELEGNMLRQHRVSTCLLFPTLERG